MCAKNDFSGLGYLKGDQHRENYVNDTEIRTKIYKNRYLEDKTYNLYLV